MPTTEATATFHGLTVTITRSAGTDGALVVFIDGPPDDDHEYNADGSPAIRVLLNDDPIYVGRPYMSAHNG